MIDHQYNYDDVFFRMVTASLAKTLNRRITWIYYFASGKKCVNIPVYSSMAGQERFLLDAFVDDITGTRVELNTDQYQRCVITLTSFAPVGDEYANPNIYIPKRFKLNDKIKEIWTRVKAIPMLINYDIEFRLDSEVEVYRCSEKILYLLFNYRFFRMNYFGLNIENVLSLPDDKPIELPRDVGGIDTDTKKTIKFSLPVKTYFPIWEIDTDRMECYDEEIDEIKRVWWDFYLHDLKNIQEDADNLDDFIDVSKKTTENFHSSLFNPNYSGSTTGYTMEL